MQLPTANTDFWINLWEEAKHKSPMRKRRQRTEEEMIETWNRRAKGFAHHSKDKKGQKRRQKVLEFLEQEGALQKGFKVLDIGAGPGNFAIPMAHIVDQVTAIEPASEMVKILQERAAEHQLDNIKIIKRTWQDIDLSKEGFVGQFDLVFASMTPGIQDGETLKKMINASRGYCYLSCFSGRRWGKAYRELWQLFFHEDLGDSPVDILYPFGVLYSMGYRPNLRFINHHWVHEQPVEEAAESIISFFENYMDITADARKTIEDYIAKHSDKGIFRQEINSCSGMMVWQVKNHFHQEVEQCPRNTQ